MDNLSFMVQWGWNQERIMLHWFCSSAVVTNFKLLFFHKQWSGEKFGCWLLPQPHDSKIEEMPFLLTIMSISSYCLMFLCPIAILLTHILHIYLFIFSVIGRWYWYGVWYLSLSCKLIWHGGSQTCIWVLKTCLAFQLSSNGCSLPKRG